MAEISNALYVGTADHVGSVDSVALISATTDELIANHADIEPIVALEFDSKTAIPSCALWSIYAHENYKITHPFHSVSSKRNSEKTVRADCRSRLR